MQQLFFFKILPWSVILVFVFGLGLKLRHWKMADDPLHTPLLIYPKKKYSFFINPIRACLFPDFLSLGARLFHLVGFFLHLALLLVLMRHLRFVLNPVPDWLIWLNPIGLWAGYALPFLLAIRILRRFLIPRLFQNSTFYDYLPLYLILAVSFTGLLARFAFPTDLVAVKDICLSFFQWDFSARSWPSGIFTLHYLLGLFLFALLPFGKMAHGLGLFVSPCLTRPDTEEKLIKPNLWQKSLYQENLRLSINAPKEVRNWDLMAYRTHLKKHWSVGGVKEVKGSFQRALEKKNKQDKI